MRKKLTSDQVYKVNLILAVIGKEKKDLAEDLGMAEGYIRQQLGGFNPISTNVQNGLMEFIEVNLFGEPSAPEVLRKDRIST